MLLGRACMRAHARPLLLPPCPPASRISAATTLHAQLGQFQARQGAGLANGVLGGNAAAAAAAAGVVRRDALGSIGIAGSSQQLGSLAGALRGTGGGGLAQPMASQPGLAQYSGLNGQGQALNYPGGARLGAAMGSMQQQLQNPRVGLLHHASSMPVSSGAPPSSMAPSQDLLSLLSRQKQVRAQQQALAGCTRTARLPLHATRPPVRATPLLLTAPNACAGLGRREAGYWEGPGRLQQGPAWAGPQIRTPRCARAAAWAAATASAC